MTAASMNEAALQDAIADEFRQFADLFDGLPASSWDAPTLCDGWRAREVVAHLTLPMWAEDETTLCGSPRIFQAWCRRPV